MGGVRGQFECVEGEAVDIMIKKKEFCDSAKTISWNHKEKAKQRWNFQRIYIFCNAYTDIAIILTCHDIFN